MKQKLNKIRSLRVIDIIRAISVFDLIVFILIILIPTAILAKANPRKGGGSGKGVSNVKITSIDPVSGPIGTTVTIYGVGFTDNNSVKIKGKILVGGLSSSDGTTLAFTLPPDTPCKLPKACPLKILASNQQGESNAYPFKVTHESVLQNLVIVTNSLPGGTENIYYETTLEADGGVLPYIWSISMGFLPPGLEIDSSNGVISGIPTSSGTSSFTATVTDSGGNEATKDFQIIIEAAPVSINSITITGRFVDYFTDQPIPNVNLLKTAQSQDATVQPSNDNGEFSITTTVNELSATDITKSTKGFWYYPSCYIYAQSMSIRRYSDNSLAVLSNIFDLDNQPVSYPITSELVDLGDVTIWPATGFRMYFDKELKITIHYPEEGRSTGNINYMMNTDGYLGGNIAPFDYPLTVDLEDRDGNIYNPPPYSHPRAEGCSKNVVLNFFNGEFSWSSQ